MFQLAVLRVMVSLLVATFAGCSSLDCTHDLTFHVFLVAQDLVAWCRYRLARVWTFRRRVRRERPF